MCSYKLATVIFFFGYLAFYLWSTTQKTLYTRYVHGQRVIYSTPESIQVLDFARPVHHPSSPGANNSNRTFLRSNPSLIPKESIFVKDVVTHLPYIVVNRAITQRFFACMIDEERIIGLRVKFLLLFKDDCFFDSYFFF